MALTNASGMADYLETQVLNLLKGTKVLSAPGATAPARPPGRPALAEAYPRASARLRQVRPARRARCPYASPIRASVRVEVRGRSRRRPSHRRPQRGRAVRRAPQRR